MNELFQPLLANLVLGSGVWLLSLWRRDASLVDLLWPLMFVLAAWIWYEPATASLVNNLLLALVMLWGARLHIHLARRNLGHGEDRRYRQLRDNHEPGFWWKSLFLVFALQALLAWIASLAVFGAFRGDNPLWLSLAGLVLALFGFVFEAVGDWQLARFKADPDSAGRVMDRGLWALTRHPNYFGDCCFWWGVWLCAAGTGYWWTLIAPALMTFLLVRVSGVTLLEKDIGERRPGYREYVRNTPAFFPAFGKLLRSAP